MRFAFLTLGALIFGAIFGSVVPASGPFLALGGTLFVGALKALVLPIIFCSVVASMARLGAQGRIGGILGVSFVYFLATMVAAVVIGL
ncbi:MAG: C4-dicarboxylate transporter DctA, partial [Myxococcales bacterium]|nr:C4-dicarboxylate transporter DctA [Myxococcales bacterium]